MQVSFALLTHAMCKLGFTRKAGVRLKNRLPAFGGWDRMTLKWCKANANGRWKYTSDKFWIPHGCGEMKSVCTHRTSFCCSGFFWPTRLTVLAWIGFSSLEHKRLENSAEVRWFGSDQLWVYSFVFAPFIYTSTVRLAAGTLSVSRR